MLDGRTAEEADEDAHTTCMTATHARALGVGVWHVHAGCVHDQGVETKDIPRYE